MSRGGRRYGRAHLPVESCHGLSSWGYFQRAQMWTDDEDDLEFSWAGDDKRMVIRFTRNGQKRTQEIALTTTPCNYGSVRFWFACPGCGRRVGKVYLPCTLYYNVLEGMRVTVFKCRHCYDLTYLQRSERDLYWTLLHRADRIAERWLGEVTRDFIYKRNWQHWDTFNNRFEQHQAMIAESNRAAVGSITRLFERSTRP